MTSDKTSGATRRVLGSMLLLMASCGDGGTTTETWEAPPPSVILISLDTLRAGHMSLYGYERETTPYLERFSTECLVFDQAHSVAPWTLISHVSMLTGLYPEQHGVVEEDLALSPEIPFLAQRLSDYGYQTVGLYRPGFVGPRYGEDRGFDVFRRHLSAEKAGEHLREEFAKLDPRRPFFLFLHLFDIHAGPLSKGRPMYDPPAPFDTIFMADARSKLKGAKFSQARDRKARLTDEQIEAMISLYDGGIRYVDSMLEKWIEGWRRDGLLDNTLLIITSDHGESLGQRNGIINGHGRVWEDALHIPIIVRFPDGYRANEREDSLVSLVDVVPTVMEAVNLPRDLRLPGYSLRGDLIPDRVVGAFRPSSFARIQLPWKVMGWATIDERKPKRVFNLVDDKLELSPLWAHEEIFRSVSVQLQEAFAKELAAHPSFDAPPIPAAEQTESMREELRTLGYAGDND